MPWYIKEGLQPGYDTHHAVTAYHFRSETPTTPGRLQWCNSLSQEPGNTSHRWANTVIFSELGPTWLNEIRAMMNAAALARSLGRILVLPRWECHCDRHWTPLIPACIMTNSDLKLPFTCPMDHLLEVHKWTEQNHVQVREVSALTVFPSPCAPLPHSSGWVRVLLWEPPSRPLGCATPCACVVGVHAYRVDAA